MPEGFDDTSDCPECGGRLVEDSDTNEVVCEECGLVVSEGNKTGPDTDTDWGKYDGVDLKSSIESGSTDHVHWSEQTSHAIVGLIKEPERTYHEYYRIENPKEFFEGCSTEQDELQRIRESDLEPFETLDLPHIEWRFSVH